MTEILLPCKECGYVTYYLPSKMVKKSLHSHCRECHHVDPERKEQRVLSDGIAGKARQRSSEGRMFDHVNRDPVYITSENVKDIGPGEATGNNREVAPGDTVEQTPDVEC